MSSDDHQDTRSPNTAGEPSPSTAGNNKSLPQTPPPRTMTVNPVLTNSTTPGSNSNPFAPAFLTSFQDATNTLLLRTLSDADSSANQTTTTTTPPTVPRRTNPLRRSLSDTLTIDYDEQNQKTPIRRLPPSSDFHQQPRKTPRVSSSPQSSAGKQSPNLRLKKLQDMVREIEKRCLEITSEEEQVLNKLLNPPHPHQLQEVEQDESVGVERLANELSCSCGKNFEMLIKHNGYCFYRLT